MALVFPQADQGFLLTSHFSPLTYHAKVVGIVPPFYGSVKLWFPISQ
jgi:hypothetical protein